ncbi:hypothetical protein FIBSPDRAFT_456816 [Athelia psychrophila]|uniref:Uncharacterized protein n=1 Tax=Athelia psychrophila TaxID=1759441 RepID=A0A166LXX2_9AGAM|nr:hypothetical protein FIBSPDRAFT_456816 [Fibularhizoctonia sp. CBS 109695]
MLRARGVGSWTALCIWGEGVGVMALVDLFGTMVSGRVNEARSPGGGLSSCTEEGKGTCDALGRSEAVSGGVHNCDPREEAIDGVGVLDDEDSEERTDAVSSDNSSASNLNCLTFGAPHSTAATAAFSALVMSVQSSIDRPVFASLACHSSRALRETCSSI